MERAEIREGKERVRALVIDPLEADGMVRVKKTVAEHEAYLEKVEQALCYMSEDGLVTVKHAISAMAKICSKCRRKEGWPSVQAIRSQAHAIETPPATMSPMVASYMASRAGRWALEQGDDFAVALLRYMRTKGFVPTKSNAGWDVIARDAKDIKDRAQRRLRLISDGTADERDRVHQENYDRTVAQTRALVLGEETKETAHA